MSWPAKFALLVLVCFFSGCGYHVSRQAPIVLPEGVTKVFLDRVVDPTTKPWLEPRLRTLLRDEFTRRGQVRWVPRDQAQALLRVEIIRFSDGSMIFDSEERTIKSEARLTLKGRIFRRADQSLLWSSGTITTRQSYVTGDASARLEAGTRAVELAVEQLADALAMGF